MKYEFTIGDTKVVVEGDDVTIALKKASATVPAPITSDWWDHGVPSFPIEDFKSKVSNFERQLREEVDTGSTTQVGKPRACGVAAVREWISEKHGRGSKLTRDLGLSSAAIYTWKRIPSKRAAAISKITGISLGRLLREAPAKPELQAAE